MAVVPRQEGMDLVNPGRVAAELLSLEGRQNISEAETKRLNYLKGLAESMRLDLDQFRKTKKSEGFRIGVDSIGEPRMAGRGTGEEPPVLDSQNENRLETRAVLTRELKDIERSIADLEAVRLRENGFLTDAQKEKLRDFQDRLDLLKQQLRMEGIEVK